MEKPMTMPADIISMMSARKLTSVPSAGISSKLSRDLSPKSLEPSRGAPKAEKSFERKETSFDNHFESAMKAAERQQERKSSVPVEKREIADEKVNRPPEDKREGKVSDVSDESTVLEKEREQLRKLEDILAILLEFGAGKGPELDPEKIKALLEDIVSRLQEGSKDSESLNKLIPADLLKSLEEIMGMLKKYFPEMPGLDQLENRIADLQKGPGGPDSELLSDEAQQSGLPTENKAAENTHEDEIRLKSHFDKMVEGLEKKISDALARYRNGQQEQEQPGSSGREGRREDLEQSLLQQFKSSAGLETAGFREGQQGSAGIVGEFDAKFGMMLNGQTQQSAGTAAVTAPQALVPYTDSQAAEILQQISKGLLSLSTNGVRQLRIQIVPEHLGQVQISLEMNDGHVSGKIGVENDAVRQLVEVSLPQLRESLEAQNIKVDSLEVAVDNNRAFLQKRQGKHGFNSDRSGLRRQKADTLENTGMDRIRAWIPRSLGYNTIELVA